MIGSTSALFALTTIVVLIAFLFADTPNEPFPRHRWSHDTLTNAVQHREPLVLTHPALDAYVASDRFALSHLCTLVSDELSDVYVAPRSDVLYDDRSRPYANHTELVGAPAYAKVSMSCAEFTLRSRHPQQYRKFVYYSRQLDRDFETFPTPPLDLSVDDPLVDTDVVHSTNIWVGHNVTAHTHYDATHNIFVQLSGRKRFTLYPPRFIPAMQPYPEAHVHDRQSQLPFPDDDALPPSASITIVLAAGEALYLPPGWLHRVHAVGESVSINVWSHSAEELLIQQANKVPVAQSLLSREVDTREQRLRKQHRLVRVLSLLVTALHAKQQQNEESLVSVWPSNATQLLRTLLQQRYSAHFSTLLPHCAPADFNSDHCPHFDPSELSGDEEDSKEQVQMANGLATVFHHTMSSLRKGGTVHLELVRQVLLTYVEHLIAFVVGLRNVCAFVRCASL